jgi:hypothetical protein
VDLADAAPLVVNFSFPSIRRNDVRWTNPPITARLQISALRGKSSWYRCVLLLYFSRPAS